MQTRRSPLEISRVQLRVRRVAAARRALLAAVCIMGTLLLLGLIGVRVAPPYDALLATAGIAGTLTSLLLGFTWLWMRAWVPAREVSLVHDDAALYAQHTEGAGASRDLLLRDHDVASGWVVEEPTHRFAQVLLTRRDKTEFALTVRSSAEAHALLEALGVAATQQRTVISLGSVARRVGAAATLAPALFCLGTAAVASLELGGLGVLAALALASFGTWGLLALFRPPQFTVGREGVDLRVSVWRYFISYDAVADVFAEGDYLVLRMADRRDERFFSSAPRAVLDALAQRMQQALAAYRRERSGASLTALERAGRSAAAWQTGVRALLEAPGGYRATSLDARALRETLDDDGSPIEQRVGAALGLVAVDRDGSHTAHVRAVAQGCASEPLRRALDHIADGALDEGSLDEALAALGSRRAL